MLELRKGESTKSYENDYFRRLATTLSKEFEERGWGGLLMGMPKSIFIEGLQIDCLLITDEQIILIDFKRYGGDLLLPPKESFFSGRWIINGEIPVKGGSSINPYQQLRKQRNKLVDILEKSIKTFDSKTVLTVVCFQDRVNIIGEIPKRVINFSITDSNSILSKIVDLIDVEKRNRQYLKKSTKSLFAEKLFYAPEYKLSIVLDEHSILDNLMIDESAGMSSQVSIKSIPSRKIYSGDYDSHIQDFLKSEDRVLIITGNTMSGKTAMIPRIREIAFDLEYIDVPVFAYSNRLRKKILKYHPEIDDIQSLFGEIYDFSNEEVDETYRKKIPIKVFDYEAVEEDFGGDVVIVDDSHLIANTSFESENVKFGSGNLINDFFAYLQLNKNPKRKIVFIGDSNRISYGSNIENVMNIDYLRSYLDSIEISSEIRKLSIPPQKNGTEIVRVCNKIAEKIESEEFNNLIINSKDEVIIVEPETTISIYEQVYNEPYLNKILVYTNERAIKINQNIKKQFSKESAMLCEGDAVMFNSSIKAFTLLNYSRNSSYSDAEKFFDYDDLRRIDNGSTAIITSVSNDRTISKYVKVKDKEINLKFVPCHVELQDSGIYEIFVFDNLLKSDKADLEPEENTAYQILLSELLHNFIEKNKFERSDEFSKMVQKNEASLAENGKPYYFKNDKGEYRLTSDGRLLPPEVKEFRSRLEYMLLSDSSSEYFKIYNAARVKYAWAITVNKAMASSFHNVIFETDQGSNHGRTNKDYFKWLYTGLSTAENSIQLMNWKPISPFVNTEFNSLTVSNPVNVKKFIFTFSNNKDENEYEFEQFLHTCFKETKWKIVDISPKKFHEIVKLRKDNDLLELIFDYNGKGEVKLPRLKAGSKENFEEVVETIKSVPQVKNDDMTNENCSIRGDFFVELADLLNSRNINVLLNTSKDWQVLFTFSKENQTAEVQCWYNSRGLISKFNHILGSKDLFDEIVDLIKKTYLLTR